MVKWFCWIFKWFLGWKTSRNIWMSANRNAVLFEISLVKNLMTLQLATDVRKIKRIFRKKIIGYCFYVLNALFWNISDAPRTTNLTSTVNPVMEGSPTVLTCDTDARPLPVYYQLYREGVLVHNSTNGTYLLDAAMHYHAGSYECVPFNLAGYGDNATHVLTINGMWVSNTVLSREFLTGRCGFAVAFNIRGLIFENGEPEQNPQGVPYKMGFLRKHCLQRTSNSLVRESPKYIPK